MIISHAHFVPKLCALELFSNQLHVLRMCTQSIYRALAALAKIGKRLVTNARAFLHA